MAKNKKPRLIFSQKVAEIIDRWLDEPFSNERSRAIDNLVIYLEESNEY